MKFNHIVKENLFRHDVMFSIGETNDEVLAHLESWGVEFNGKKSKKILKKMDYAGLTVRLKRGQQLIRIPKFVGNIDEFSTVIHEIFHASFVILHNVGIELTPDTEEAYAYLIAFFYREFVTHFLLEEEKVKVWDGNIFEG